jgi:hypothetical protein
MSTDDFPFGTEVSKNKTWLEKVPLRKNLLKLRQPRFKADSFEQFTRRAKNKAKKANQQRGRKKHGRTTGT